MLGVSISIVLVCSTFFSIKCNDVLKFAGTVQIRNVVSLFRCKSRGRYRSAARSPVEIVGLNLTEGMDVCLL
jgi:hypothetical protein